MILPGLSVKRLQRLAGGPNTSMMELATNSMICLKQACIADGTAVCKAACTVV